MGAKGCPLIRKTTLSVHPHTQAPGSVLWPARPHMNTPEISGSLAHLISMTAGWTMEEAEVQTDWARPGTQIF